MTGTVNSEFLEQYEIVRFTINNEIIETFDLYNRDTFEYCSLGRDAASTGKIHRETRRTGRSIVAVVVSLTRAS